MEIILLEDIVNVGKLGDVTKVRNGYARNYLIPQGKALRATAQVVEEFGIRKAQYEKKQEESRELARKKQEQLEGKVFSISAKAGVDGKLFGSVTAFDISSEVEKSSNVALKKSEVMLPHGPIKTIGEFEVMISLSHGVHATIKVNVAPQE